MDLHFVLLDVLIPLDLTDIKLRLQIIHFSNLLVLRLLDFLYSRVFCILYWLASNRFCGQDHLHEVSFKVLFAKLFIRIDVVCHVDKVPVDFIIYALVQSCPD